MDELLEWLRSAPLKQLTYIGEQYLMFEDRCEPMWEVVNAAGDRRLITAAQKTEYGITEGGRCWSTVRKPSTSGLNVK